MKLLYNDCLYEESNNDIRYGYKVVLFDGKDAISLADNTVKYPLRKNSITSGNMYLATSPKFATDYYYSEPEDESDLPSLLLTYEYHIISDLVKGDPNEQDAATGGSEIIVKKAKLISALNLVTNEKLF